MTQATGVVGKLWAFLLEQEQDGEASLGKGGYKGNRGQLHEHRSSAGFLGQHRVREQQGWKGAYPVPSLYR